MRIAIPKEIMANERRVAATPDTVAKYRKLGHEVYVEVGAGAGIFASDDAYRAAGAVVVRDVESLFVAGVDQVEHLGPEWVFHRAVFSCVRIGADLGTFGASLCA